jgi:hypothetical protein
VRRLLTEFDGYECKEPERGKFTLAFKGFKDAVGFAVTIQSALLDLDYPPVLLEAEECAEVSDTNHPCSTCWRSVLKVVRRSIMIWRRTSFMVAVTLMITYYVA